MTEPILSPDGKWMWTGTEWIPAPPEPSQDTKIQNTAQDINTQIDRLLQRSTISFGSDHSNSLVEIQKYRLENEKHLLDALNLSKKLGDKSVLANTTLAYGDFLEKTMYLMYNSFEFKELLNVTATLSESSLYGWYEDNATLEKLKKTTTHFSRYIVEETEGSYRVEMDWDEFPWDIMGGFYTSEIPGTSVDNVYKESLRLYSELGDKSGMAKSNLGLARYGSRHSIFGLGRDSFYDMDWIYNLSQNFKDAIKLFTEQNDLKNLGVVKILYGLRNISLFSSVTDANVHPAEDTDWIGEGVANLRDAGEYSLIPNWAVAKKDWGKWMLKGIPSFRHFNQITGIPD
jgi:hypothetical protein